jgi:hypothetical protein
MMGSFRRLIDDLALKEIQLHGRKFTWSNQQANPTLVRLDRVLCTVDWENLYPNVLLQSAASEDSDHCPLLLGQKDIKRGKRRFHFEAFWPKLDGFLEAVQGAWNSVQPKQCPFLTLEMKLKAIARGHQAWSDSVTPGPWVHRATRPGPQPKSEDSPAAPVQGSSSTIGGGQRTTENRIGLSPSRSSSSTERSDPGASSKASRPGSPPAATGCDR